MSSRALYVLAGLQVARQGHALLQESSERSRGLLGDSSERPVDEDTRTVALPGRGERAALKATALAFKYGLGRGVHS